MTFRTLLTLAIVTAAAVLPGCAAYKIDKTVEPSPQEVSAIGREIAKVRAFHQAVYDVSTFAVDRCARKTVREPFALLTLGTLGDHLSKEQIAAYWRAGGFDERWHVIWALEGSGLAPGDAVVRINGNKLDNNKSGWGEAPLALYFREVYNGRSAAEAGKPFRVTLASGEERQVQMKPSCRTVVWAMPLTSDNGHSEVPPNQPIVIPPNAIRAARSQDELRYLAALAVYYSASSEANARRWGAIAAGAVGSALFAVAPLVTAAAQGTALNVAGHKVATSGMVENAAHFATQVVADMGGSPHAGLDLVARLQGEKLAATRVLLDAEEQARVKQLADHLRTSAASR